MGTENQGEAEDLKTTTEVFSLLMVGIAFFVASIASYNLDSVLSDGLVGTAAVIFLYAYLLWYQKKGES
jgi:hypothetical protein